MNAQAQFRSYKQNIPKENIAYEHSVHPVGTMYQRAGIITDAVDKSRSH